MDDAAADGVVKFQCDWQRRALDDVPAVLIGYRNQLAARGLIGRDAATAIDFGNISLRAANGRVFISGTQTGHLPVAGPEAFARIDDYDIYGNRVK